jgi:hypothetical protein
MSRHGPAAGGGATARGGSESANDTGGRTALEREHVRGRYFHHVGTVARPHGDPLPLPMPTGLPGGIRCGRRRYLEKRLREAADRHARIREAVQALNLLDGATVEGLPAQVPVGRGRARLGSSRGGRELSDISASQRSILARVARRVAWYGRPPADVPQQGALQELLRMRDLYDDAPRALVECDIDKIKVLKRTFEVRDIRSRLPPEGQHFLDHPERFIERTAAELDRLQDGCVPIKPYWCPRLRRDRELRVELFRRLHKIHLVGFRPKIRSQVSLFFVGKKDGGQRMVCDARQVNLAHRLPPRSALAGPGALACLDLSDEALRASGFDASQDLSQLSLFGASADMCDGFYQNTNKRLADWFGFDFPETASTFGISSVYCPETDAEVEVDPSRRVSQCSKG